MTIEQEIECWTKHASLLGQRYVDLFVTATARSQTGFFDQVIRPQLFTGDTYVGIESSAQITGRSHHTAEGLLKLDCGPSSWQALAYFTNPMMVDMSGELSPTDRCVFTGKHTFTFEFDRNDIAFLREQLDWLPRGAAWQKSPIGELYKHCSKFADFFGVTVAYSGNKSLHIHAVFNTGPYRDLHGDVLQPAPGLRAHWKVLADAVVAILKPTPASDGRGGTKPMLPDNALKSPVAYRRLPGGSRQLTSANLMGIPAQTRVPQIVLWEQFRQRAARGSTALFFSPSLFAIDPAADRRPPAARSSRLGGTLTPAEIAYCEEKLRSFFPGPDGLKLSELRFDPARNEYCAHFYNGLTDRNPSSVLYESHRKVLVCGSDAGLPADYRDELPCSLGAMIELCCKQLADQTAQKEAEADPSIYWIDCDGEPAFQYDGPAYRRIGTEFAFRFRETVVDNETARAVMQEFLPQLIEDEAICLVRGPEGASKTTSIVREHHTIMEKLRQRGVRGLAAYCFADYDNTLEKIASFNDFHGGERYFAILWPSFSATYSEVCAKLRLTPIGDEELRQSGYRPLIELIRRKQPEVLDEFEKLHCAMWKEIGDREPVLFMVHAVAQMWQHENQSRTMWAKSRWIEAEDNDHHRATLIEETSLAFLVHDEVKWSTFSDAINATTYAWLQALPKPMQTAFRNGQIGKFRTLLDKHVAAVRWPDDTLIVSTDIQRYLSGDPWTEVTVADTSEYFRRSCDDPEYDIYAKRYGKIWYMRSRSWWTHGRRQIADRIIFLTTETVPTAVAEKAHPGMYIVELEAQHMQRDVIEVLIQRSVNIASLEELCKKTLKELKEDTGEEWFGISNKAPIEGVITHAKARGANGLIGCNVLQTCTFMAPEDFELHQALNAWTGRRDLVSWRHIDEINQSAGRNLGFRRREGVGHILLINLRLYGTLCLTDAFAGLRYDLSLQVDNDQRKNAKASANSAATNGES